MPSLDKNANEDDGEEALITGIETVESEELIKRCQGSYKVINDDRNGLVMSPRDRAFDFQIRFMEISRDGERIVKKPAKMLSQSGKANWVYVIFEKADTDFLIELDNTKNKSRIGFDLNIGCGSSGQRFFIKEGRVGSLRALEANGGQLHVLSQESPQAKLLMQEKATEERLRLRKVKRECGLIRMDPIQVEKVDNCMTKSAKRGSANPGDPLHSELLPYPLDEIGLISESNPLAIVLGEETDQRFDQNAEPFIMGKKFKGITFELMKKPKYKMP